jgi:hypothetical protein
VSQSVLGTMRQQGPNTETELELCHLHIGHTACSYSHDKTQKLAALRSREGANGKPVKGPNDPGLRNRPSTMKKRAACDGNLKEMETK